MNKKGDYNLAAILGLVAVGFIILSLSGIISMWYIIVGIIFLLLAFKAN